MFFHRLNNVFFAPAVGVCSYSTVRKSVISSGSMQSVSVWSTDGLLQMTFALK